MKDATLIASEPASGRPISAPARAIGAEKTPRPSLKRLVVAGSAWTLIGYGASQVIRFACNVALARLLFPEAMGLMAMVSVVMQGLQMLSDIGIQQSVIQDSRGVDPAFLNTAWTMHVVRGALLSLAAAALGWPLSRLWGMPQLAQLIPVVGLTTLISGLASTKLFTLNRELVLARMTVLDLLTQGASAAFSIGLAWYSRSVWALVWGWMAAAALKTLWSHWGLPGPNNRFRWDREASASIVRFGRWIFISSLLGFFVSRGDRLILVGFFDEARLGVYSNAFMLSAVLLELLQAVGDRVLFPLFVRLKDRPREELRRMTAKIRVVIMLTILPIACLLVVLGPAVVHLLYDNRYSDAGWMLQVLAAGAIFSIVPSTAPVYMAFGDSQIFLLMVLTRSILLLISMLVGGWLGGQTGLVVGVAVTNALHYPFNAWALRRYGLWIARLDLIGFASAAAVVGLGLWLKSIL